MSANHVHVFEECGVEVFVAECEWVVLEVGWDVEEGSDGWEVEVVFDLSGSFLC